MTKSFSFTIIKAVIAYNVFMIASCGPSPGQVERISAGDGRKEHVYKSLSDIQVIADRMKKEGAEDKGTLTFEGDVTLQYSQYVRFNANRLSIRFANGSKIISVELIGNVMMEKGTVKIRSDRAVSDNFGLHIDFVERVRITTEELKVRAKEARYHFILGDISIGIQY